MSTIRTTLAAALIVAAAHAGETDPPFDAPSILIDGPADVVTRVDVDGDGFDDLVINLTGGAPRVILSLDGGGLSDTTPTDLPALVDHRWLFADIDGDARADAVATKSFDTTVRVWLGAGDGSFTPAPDVRLSEFGREAVLGDVDGDGTADLVAAFEDTPRLRVVLGAVEAPFSEHVDVVAPLGAEPVVVADVDGDGRIDIVSTTGVELRGATLDVIRGLGDRTFAPPFSALVGEVLRVAAGDHDGDGDAELAVVTDEGVRLVDVSADALTLIADVDTLLGDAVWTDVDEDGHDDLVVGNAGGSFSRFAVLASQPGSDEPLVEVFRASGPAVFRTPTPLDVDRDGHVDVVFGQPFQSWLHVARGRGDGSFDDHLAGTFLFDVADVDRDGRLDVVTFERLPSGDWRALLQRGAFGRSFDPPELVFATTSLVIDMQLGDFDGDGHADVVFTDVPAAFGGRLTVLRGDGTGAFDLAARVVLAEARELDVADVDGDGRDDVVVGGKTVRLFVVRSSGELVEAWSVDSFSAATPFFADVDGIDPPDLVLRRFSDSPQVHLAVGQADFAPPIPLPFDLTLYAPWTFADLTGDGVTDALGFEPASGTLSLFSGAGDGSFAFASTLDLPFQPSTTALGDLDGDGLDDLVLSRLERFAVALGVDGGFAPAVELPGLPARAVRTQLVDIHGDGAPAYVFGGLTELFVLPNERSPWRDLGSSTAGSAGFARLEGEGPLLGGHPVGLRATGAVPEVPATLVIGFGASPTPFAGGLLVPSPDVLVTGLVTDADGTLELAAPWPAGVPSDTPLVFQLWCVDANAPTGFSSTIALEATTP